MRIWRFAAAFGGISIVRLSRVVYFQTVGVEVYLVFFAPRSQIIGDGFAEIKTFPSPVGLDIIIQIDGQLLQKSPSARVKCRGFLPGFSAPHCSHNTFPVRRGLGLLLTRFSISTFLQVIPGEWCGSRFCRLFLCR